MNNKKCFKAAISIVIVLSNAYKSFSFIISI